MTSHFRSDFNVDDLFYLIAKLLVDGRLTIGSSFENRSISDLTWFTCAAIPIHILAVKRNDHGIVPYVFDNARTPNSFFIDCFSFEPNCLCFQLTWVHLVRSKQVVSIKQVLRTTDCGLRTGYKTRTRV